MSTVSDRPRQGTVIELCPTHGVRCYSNRSEPTFTRYYCPRCDYSKKVPRGEEKLIELYLPLGSGAAIGERLNRAAIEGLSQRQAESLMKSLGFIAQLVKARENGASR